MRVDVQGSAVLIQGHELSDAEVERIEAWMRAHSPFTRGALMGYVYCSGPAWARLDQMDHALVDALLASAKAAGQLRWERLGWTWVGRRPDRAGAAIFNVGAH